MSTFDNYVDSVFTQGRALIAATFTQTRDESRAIFETHLTNSRERLDRWTKLLVLGELRPEEFKLLVNNQVTLGRMRMRTTKVIGKAAARDFRDKLRGIFIDNAFSHFLGL